MAIPEQMRALQIDSYHEDPFDAIRSLKTISKPIPKPLSGQVLVRVAAAPCNPSDILLLQGKYGKKKNLPAIPGWEGSGTVVATGGGLLARWLLGKRVAFSVQNEGDGSWAEYCAVDAKTCLPLRKGVSFDQGACLIINPLTAVGLIDEAVVNGHSAIIQTGAASQVGRMVLQLANLKGIPVIHVVRRREQEDLLKKLGAEIVLNSETTGFEHALKTEAKRLNATIAFDAVAGDMTGTLHSAMPNQSTILVYGALSGSPCSHISPLGLIFQEKCVKGFYLSSWISKKGFWGMYYATQQVQKLIAEGVFHTEINARVPLDQAAKALAIYQKEMTAGKVLITP
jgi:NADPH2:quinone reductase